MIPLLATALVVRADYVPQDGNHGSVLLHRVKPLNFANYISKSLLPVDRLADRLDPDHITYEFEDAANFRVRVVEVSANEASRREARQNPEMQAQIAKVAALDAAPSLFDSVVLDRADIARLPKVGDVVYLYIHTAKPGMFEDLRRSYNDKLARPFKAVVPQTSRLTFADAKKGRIVDFLFFPNQAMADQLHGGAVRPKILAATAPYRYSYEAERYVVGAIR